MFSLCSPQLILTRSLQISGQNKSEAREPQGLLKILKVLSLAPFLKERKIQIRIFFLIVRGNCADRSLVAALSSSTTTRVNAERLQSPRSSEVLRGREKPKKGTFLCLDIRFSQRLVTDRILEIEFSRKIMHAFKVS